MPFTKNYALCYILKATLQSHVCMNNDIKLAEINPPRNPNTTNTLNSRYLTTKPLAPLGREAG